MGTNNDPDYEKVTIGGIEYLTFPESVKFTKIKRETLQQQVNRKTLDVKKIGKYLFVPFKKCEELRDRGENDKKLEKFKELVSMDITVEELQRIIEERKNLKSSEGK
jgi:hypothetical protein